MTQTTQPPAPAELTEASPGGSDAGSGFLPVVYSTVNATVGAPGQRHARLAVGAHWYRHDPVVLANPGLFSEDPRWGMQFTETPPGYDPDGRSMTPTLAGNIPNVSRVGVPEAEAPAPTRGHRHGGKRSV